MAYSGKTGGGGGGIPPQEQIKAQAKFKKILEDNPDYIVAHTGLSFDRIPSVTGVPIRQQSRPPRTDCLSHFKTDKSKEDLVGVIKGCLYKKGIPCFTSETETVISVKEMEENRYILSLEISYYPIGEEIFGVDFHQVGGDKYKFSEIFNDIRSLLAPESTDEDGNDETGSSGGGSVARYNIPPCDKSKYNDNLRFDHMI